MKTISVNLYQFSELSEDAKQKAISNLSDINVSHDWWDCTYDDAENIGLKITSFELDRNRHAKGKFLYNGEDVAERITKEHGKDCETYKTAATFLQDRKELTEKYGAEPDEDETNEMQSEREELEEEFLNSLLEGYSKMLQDESEYLQSEKAIIETIEANEYFFTEDGKLA